MRRYITALLAALHLAVVTRQQTEQREDPAGQAAPAAYASPKGQETAPRTQETSPTTAKKVRTTPEGKSKATEETQRMNGN